MVSEEGRGTILVVSEEGVQFWWSLKRGYKSGGLWRRGTILVVSEEVGTILVVSEEGVQYMWSLNTYMRFFSKLMMLIMK